MLDDLDFGDIVLFCRMVSVPPIDQPIAIPTLDPEYVNRREQFIGTRIYANSSLVDPRPLRRLVDLVAYSRVVAP